MTDAPTGQATESPPPPPFSAPRRRLCRDPGNRRIGGVASGVAHYLGLDVTVARVLFVVIAAVTGGAAVIAYVMAWALLPEPGEPETRLEARWRRRDFTGLTVAGIIGLIVLCLAGGAGWGTGWGWGWPGLLTPLALVAAGVVLFLHLERGNDQPRSILTEPSPQSVDPTNPTYPTTPTDSAALLSPEPVSASPELQTSGSGSGADPTAPHGTVPWWEAPPPPVRTRRPSPMLRNLTLAAACLFAAGATLLDALGAVDVSARFVLSGMLLIVAAGILVSTWWGRRRGLLFAAFLLSVAVAVSCIPGLSLAGGIGDRVERPTSVAEVSDKEYRLGIGDYEIDLTRLTLPTDRTLRLTAGLGAGRLDISVPREAQVDLSGHISAGEVRIDGRPAELSGIDIDLDRRLRAPSDAPHIDLEIDAGLAEVVVHRVA